MATFRCVVCKATHNTVSEMKECHTKNGALIGGDNSSTVKTSEVKKEKGYELFTFETQEARDAFVQATPGAQVRTTDVKRVSVFNKDTEAYETIVTKTYKVIVHK